MRSRLTAILLALGAACGGPAASDRAAYLAALQTADADAAERACGTIEDRVLAGECALFVAQGRARGGDADGADATCAGIAHEGWREVCHFEVVDGLALWGEEAITACGRAGAFSDRCLSHALQRHAGRIAHRYGMGQEADLLAWISARRAEYGLTEDTGVARAITAQHIAWRSCPDRAAGCGPFSLALCGTAPEDTCRQAYKVYVRSAAQGTDRVAGACAAPITRRRVAEAGLPDWTPDAESLARAVWEQLCRAARGRPDARGSARPG